MFCQNVSAKFVVGMNTIHNGPMFPMGTAKPLAIEYFIHKGGDEKLFPEDQANESAYFFQNLGLLGKVPVMYDGVVCNASEGVTGSVRIVGSDGITAVNFKLEPLQCMQSSYVSGVF